MGMGQRMAETGGKTDVTRPGLRQPNLSLLLRNGTKFYNLRRKYLKKSADTYLNMKRFKSCRESPMMSPRPMKRRDSSASLMFSLSGRKRKRKVDDDALSVQSLDFNIQEPSKKRRASIARISSITNLLSPSAKKVGRAIQRSFSFKAPSPAKPCTPARRTTPSKRPRPSVSEHRHSRHWHEMAPPDVLTKMEKREVQRQEAIHELLMGEYDMIQDLKMVKQLYYDSMSTLNLMTIEELQEIFGIVETLVPIHEECVDKINSLRRTDQSIDCIAQVLIDWLPCLECYIEYCANQVYAKALLDKKKEDPKVVDFLQRCQESKFSRKLDLWNFLDLPRSRLVKYPLLLKKIQEKTPDNLFEKRLLDESIQIIEGIVNKVDQKTGESKCNFTKGRLEYLEDRQRSELIDSSRVLLCEGVLRNNRGTKLNVFLFESVLVLTRPASRNGELRHQVYREPIPASELVVEDLKDGQAKKGSFRNAFSQGNAGKNMFKVSFYHPKDGQSHTLQANDEHDKKQWLQCLRSVESSQSRLSPPLQPIVLTNDPCEPLDCESDA